MDVKIKFLKPFKDGNIFPVSKKMFQIEIVSDRVVKMIQNSGGEIEVIERIIPPSTREPAAKNAKA